MCNLIAIFASLLRIATAALLVWICVQALPAWDARAAFAALPDYDYRVEAERLRSAEQYSEALLVVDAGLNADPDPVMRERLDDARVGIVAERDAFIRRLSDVGQGALTGTGDSVEALAGAVAADLFVFGDVRDLVIQGGKGLRGEDTDEVIVALSAAGIALTFAPEIDFGTAVLKFARRAGALSEAFARRLLKLTRDAISERDMTPLADVAGDVATLGRQAQPAAAVAILKHIDDPEALRAAARVSQRPGGSFALWVGEKPALELAQQGAAGEALLLRAARKGRAGVDYAASHLRLLTRAHPLIGLIKGVYKGNVERLLGDWLMQQAPAVLGLLAGWLLFECWRFAHRVGLAMRKPASVKEIVEEQPPAPQPKPVRRAPSA
ncbi:MAG: hypothetical protein JWQ90_3212 [Hydrocarboniphaga sp.]|uniref:hypothetical protein n=1 Tax=Hydrocarboniphaga sp. TaxID=2033016 RepID=UPI0026254152|nr:hypothetical protein [Hydrocarboniphaga sp.]MDB5970762.1 hypothetical protein [Hydrocarboniphaga sp.]